MLAANTRDAHNDNRITSDARFGMAGLDEESGLLIDELDLLTLVSDLTGSLPSLKSLQELLHSGFPGLDEIPSFLRQVTDITSGLPLQPGIVNAVQGTRRRSTAARRPRTSWAPCVERRKIIFHGASGRHA